MSVFNQIERRIAEIETNIPLEIRVVVSHQRLPAGLGGLRLSLILLLCFALSIELLWIPVPIWILLLFALILIFLPLGPFDRFPGAHRLLLKQERYFGMSAQAHAAFHDLRMGATADGYALLLFFSVPERQFYILPDAKIGGEWPKEEWLELTKNLSENLSKHPDPLDSGIQDACLELLAVIEDKAKLRLGPRLSPAKSNELDNSVVVINRKTKAHRARILGP